MAGQKESPGHCALPPGGHVGPGGFLLIYLLTSTNQRV